MKKNSFLVRMSVKRLAACTQSSLTIILVLAVCFFAFLVLLEPIFEVCASWSYVQETKRTWQVSANINSDVVTHNGTSGLYSELLWGSSFAEIEEVKGIYARYDYAQEERDDFFESNISQISIYVAGNPRYSPEIQVIEGRIFSDQELESGENVIILPMDSGYRVGDTFSIGGTDYKIIGLTLSESKVWITESNALANDDFYLEVSYVVFVNPLNDTQEKEFTALVISVWGGSPENYYADTLVEFFMDLLGYAILIAFIMFCAFSIVVQLFGFMVRSRRYEFSIYKILGMKAAMFSALFLYPVIMLDIVGCVTGWILFKVSGPLLIRLGMETHVRIIWLAAAAAIIFAVSIGTMTPGLVRLYKRSEVK